MTTSCPDWRALCQRHEAAADDTPGWRSALDHLDRCSACQVDAPAFDPTLMFRRMPAFEVDRDGVEAMKQAVTGMRRAQTIEHRRGSLARPWVRAAALAAVLLGSLMLRGAGDVAPDGVGPEARNRNIAPTASMAPASIAPETVASDVELWRMPLIETADPTYGEIIQVDDDDISVVMVMSSEIDV